MNLVVLHQECWVVLQGVPFIENEGVFNLKWGSLYLLPNNIAIIARDRLPYTCDASKSDANTYLLNKYATIITIEIEL